MTPEIAAAALRAVGYNNTLINNFKNRVSGLRQATKLKQKY